MRGITQDGKDTYWAAIDRGSGWSCRFNLTGEKYESKIYEWDKPEWGLSYKYGMYSDQSGNVWTASGQENLIIKYNPFTEIISRLNYQHENIWSFFEDDDGIIWFGSDEGTIGYIADDQTIRDLPDLDGLVRKGGCTYYFLEQENGKVFLATDNGLYVLDVKSKNVYPYNSEDLPFLRNTIYHIHKDKDGSLWLATKGMGLIHWYPYSKEYTRFTKADGLPNNTLYAIYEDGKNNLWMSSDLRHHPIQ